MKQTPNERNTERAARFRDHETRIETYKGVRTKLGLHLSKMGLINGSSFWKCSPFAATGRLSVSSAACQSWAVVSHSVRVCARERQQIKRWKTNFSALLFVRVLYSYIHITHTRSRYGPHWASLTQKEVDCRSVRLWVTLSHHISFSSVGQKKSTTTARESTFPLCPL